MDKCRLQSAPMADDPTDRLLSGWDDARGTDLEVGTFQVTARLAQISPRLVRRREAVSAMGSA